MGEYLTIGSYDHWKFATCEDARYLRRAEALELLPLDTHPAQELRYAINSAKTFWRFPWPWEDGQSGMHVITHQDQRSSPRFAETIVVDAFPFDLIEHTPLSLYASAGMREGSHGGYGFNIPVPCPLSNPPAKQAHKIIQIIAERYDEQCRPLTVFACGYCGHWFSLTPTETEHFEAIRAALREESNLYKTSDPERCRMLRAIADRLHLNRAA